MIAKVKSFILHGLEAVPVTVECEVRPGIGVHLVGLADGSTKESLLRVVTALQSMGYGLPGKKTIINIAPASPYSSSSGLDVPIALAVLAASEQETFPRLDQLLLAGELGLDGSVRHIPGGYSAGELAKSLGLGTALPQGTSHDALAAGNEETYRLKTLHDAIVVAKAPDEELLEVNGSDDAWSKDYTKTMRQLPLVNEKTLHGLAAASIAGFDVVVVGPDTAAKEAANAYARLCYDGPDADILRIRSVTGLPLRREEPIVKAFAGGSLPSLLGGGPQCRPGLVTLAHKATLAINTASEVPRQTAEALRRIREDGKVTIARLKQKVEYPARFHLALIDRPERMQDVVERFQQLHLAVVDTTPQPGDKPVDEKQWNDTLDRVGKSRKQSIERWGSLLADVRGRDLDVPLYGTFGGLMDRLSGILDVSVTRQADIVRLAAAIKAMDNSDPLEIDEASVMEAIAVMPKKINVV